MTQDKFETLRARLEEQLRADVELLYEAHRVKLRAYETIRRSRAELEEGDLLGAAPPTPPRAVPAPPAASPAKRREVGSVLDALEEILDQLPEEFDKNDVHRLLGFAPSRATLSRAFEQLCDEKALTIIDRGSGRFPMRFRKTGIAPEG